MKKLMTIVLASVIASSNAFAAAINHIGVADFATLERDFTPPLFINAKKNNEITHSKVNSFTLMVAVKNNLKSEVRQLALNIAKQKKLSAVYPKNMVVFSSDYQVTNITADLKATLIKKYKLDPKALEKIHKQLSFRHRQFR